MNADVLEVTAAPVAVVAAVHAQSDAVSAIAFRAFVSVCGFLIVVVAAE